MEDKILEAIENLVGKLFTKKALSVSGVTGFVGDTFNSASEGYVTKEVLNVIKKHVSNASWVGLSSAIPGVGATINATAFAGILWKMYYDINKTLGISFGENFVKSVASGVSGNLAATALNTGLSCIPGIGNLIASVGGLISNRVALYSASYVYIQALTKMVSSGDFSETALRRAIDGEFGNVEDDDDYDYESLDDVECEAELQIVKIDHNIIQDNVKGMNLRLEISIDGYKDRHLKLLVWATDDNGNWLHDMNGVFHDSDGDVCFVENLIPSYDYTLWEDYSFFIPYYELHNDGRRVNLKLRIQDEDNEVISSLNRTIYSAMDSDCIDVWHELNTTSGGEKGFTIHYTLNLYEAENQRFSAIVGFYNSDKVTELRDSSGNCIRVVDEFHSSYETAVCDDFKIFVPYSKLSNAESGFCYQLWVLNKSEHKVVLTSDFSNYIEWV